MKENMEYNPNMLVIRHEQKGTSRLSREGNKGRSSCSRRREEEEDKDSFGVGAKESTLRVSGRYNWANTNPMALRPPEKSIGARYGAEAMAPVNNPPTAVRCYY